MKFDFARMSDDEFSQFAVRHPRPSSGRDPFQLFGRKSSDKTDDHTPDVCELIAATSRY